MLPLNGGIKLLFQVSLRGWHSLTSYLHLKQPFPPLLHFDNAVLHASLKRDLVFDAGTNRSLAFLHQMVNFVGQLPDIVCNEANKLRLLRRSDLVFRD